MSLSDPIKDSTASPSYCCANFLGNTYTKCTLFVLGVLAVCGGYVYLRQYPRIYMGGGTLLIALSILGFCIPKNAPPAKHESAEAPAPATTIIREDTSRSLEKYPLKFSHEELRKDPVGDALVEALDDSALGVREFSYPDSDDRRRSKHGLMMQSYLITFRASDKTLQSRENFRIQLTPERVTDKSSSWGGKWKIAVLAHASELEAKRKNYDKLKLTNEDFVAILRGQTHPLELVAEGMDRAPLPQDVFAASEYLCRFDYRT